MPSRSEGRRDTERRPVLAIRSPLWLGVAGLALVLVLPVVPAAAAERSVSDVVLVDSGAVITEDLYAAGNRVVIQGRVDGDLVASAFEDVTISGTVTGDVITLSDSLVVTGSVEGSVRAVARRMDLAGQVGGDVVALGWDLGLDGSIGGDGITWARSVTISGDVGGDVEGQMRSLDLGGDVEGNVDVTVRTLRTSPGAGVGGDLGYRSDVAQEVDESAVSGSVVHRTPLAANIRVRALIVMAKLVLSLAAGVTGLLAMWAFPASAERAAAVVRDSWWRAWLRGAGLAIVPLLLLVGAGVLVSLTPLEAALPALGVLVPLFLAVGGVIAALVMAAPAAIYPWLGNPRGGDRTRVRSYLLGMIGVTLAVLVPWVTWVVLVGLVPVGVGGWLKRSAPAPV